MSWHSDEKDLKKNGAIASVSFGAERKFAFKHKDSKETYQKFLARKLTANEKTRPTHWLHCLPPTTQRHYS
jgi:alkylated DNA repair dioxygenase AlkB